MTPQPKDQTSRAKVWPERLGWLATILLLSGAAWLGLLLRVYWTDPDRFGKVGQASAGPAALLSLAATLAVLAALRLQQEEVALQRETSQAEFSLAQIEAFMGTYLSLLDAVDRAGDAVRVYGGGQEHIGMSVVEWAGQQLGAVVMSGGPPSSESWTNALQKLLDEAPTLRRRVSSVMVAVRRLHFAPPFVPCRERRLLRDALRSRLIPEDLLLLFAWGLAPESGQTAVPSIVGTALFERLESHSPAVYTSVGLYPEGAFGTYQCDDSAKPRP